jgi:hypothetical protein
MKDGRKVRTIRQSPDDPPDGRTSDFYEYLIT